MKTLLLSVALATVSSLPAQQSPLLPQAERTLIAHMIEINREWLTMPVSTELMAVTSFSSDVQRIQKHLLLVEQSLRISTPEGISGECLLNRQAMLDELHRYALNGIFPTNHYHACRQPYFIDNFGVACAVGDLMIASGNKDVAMKVHDEMNYAYIREIPFLELNQWADENGFNKDELAWIQPAYQAPHPWSALGGGVNGDVVAILPTGHYNEVIVVGDFDSAGTTSTTGVVLWDGVGFTDLGAPAGDILCAALGGGSVGGEAFMIGGSFEVQGNHYDVAIRDHGSWTFTQSLPGVFTTVTAVLPALLPGYFGENCWAGYYDDLSGRTYFVQTPYGITEFNGRINAMESGWFDPDSLWLSGVIVGGDFTSLANGTPLSYVAVFHQGIWQPFAQGLDNVVYCLRTGNESLYAGGRFYDDQKNPTFGIAKYYAGSWQNLISHDQITIDSTDERVLHINSGWIGGRFGVWDGLYAGANLALLHEPGNSLYTKGSFDKPVTSVASGWGTGVLVGGEFSDHIVKEWPTGLTIPEHPGDLMVSPNPMSSSTTIQIPAEAHGALSVRLTSADGRMVDADWNLSSNNVILNRGSLAAGIYLCTLLRADQVIASTRLAIVD